ncbi:gpi-anchored cell wall beta--endoglucanase [Lasallia pustulata]|uniref:Probable glucan endo-1,3-beta-glucosidase eglC n=1 Tax=Lasallia pustulata TaxID=136370 RepID=A0A1W5D2R2_9LECA|nr:gpi-anchored cell wall beta--endoglucanase [Lasallia pustulata]
MLSNLSLLALVASLPSITSAAYQGFNYGTTFTDGSAKSQSDFQTEFTTAKNLVGTSGFTSARLYTMIQAGTASDVTSAIPAANATDTSLLLGMWASGGADAFANELSALRAAISTYGSFLGSHVAGISVGSEDLYRVSPIGIAANAGVGAGPDIVSGYIAQVRSAIANTALSGVPVGHVDTWTAWVDGSNAGVVADSDFIGMDVYPYFQNTMTNSIEDGQALFLEALANTTAAAQGKPVWITETGWPVSGPTENLGVPSLANAKTYWDQVGCPLFGKTNTWWYALQDAAPTTPSPSFGVVGASGGTTPLYDLSCSANTSSSSSSATSSTSATSASSGSSSTTSLASSVGAGRIASADSGVTSIAGSGPIVISADSSISAMAAAASGGSGSGTASSGPAQSTATATAGAGGIAAGSGVPVAPGSGGVNTTASSGNTSTSAKPSASTYTGGASILSGTVSSAIGLLVAVVAAL